MYFFVYILVFFCFLLLDFPWEKRRHSMFITFFCMEKKRLNIHDLVSYVKKSNIVDVHNFGDNPLGYILEKYSKILLFTLDFDVSVEVKKLRDIDYAFEMGSVFSNGREVTYCVLQNGHPLSLKMLVGCV